MISTAYIKVETALTNVESKVAEALTRGHKKKARTRQQLIRAAMKILARKSVGEFTLNELSRVAEVSQGTTYNYFRSKEEVVNATGIALAAELAFIIDRASEGVESGAERVVIGIRTFIRKSLHEPDWASVITHVVRHVEGWDSALAHFVKQDISGGLKEGLFDYESEHLALGLLVSGVLSVMLSIIEDRYQEGDDVRMTKMLLIALGMDKTKAEEIVLKDHLARIEFALEESKKLKSE